MYSKEPGNAANSSIIIYYADQSGTKDEDNTPLPPPMHEDIPPLPPPMHEDIPPLPPPMHEDIPPLPPPMPSLEELQKMYAGT